jgi:hypothetical protein
VYSERGWPDAMVTIDAKLKPFKSRRVGLLAIRLKGGE